ncbi:sensor histidine kinase [Holophaga foetida]|uniref:sensor histidine kinase n=1 Tax=Holophaga foetida TaxID=35839 RepID=UPI0002471810|nr:HAMP domain-containing sensor histidine kinase [Holophaga foetida]
MKKRGFSLFTKTLFWLFLNLTVLPVILLVTSILFNHQIILHDILAIQGHARMRKAFRLVCDDLAGRPEDQWSDTLIRYSNKYKVDLVIIFGDGTCYASMPFRLDESILNKVRYSIDQYHTLQHREYLGQPVPLLPENNPLHPHLLMQTGNPPLFWTGVVIEMPHGPKSKMSTAMISTVSDSVTGNGFLLEPLPWVLILVAVALISVVLWLPLIHRITRPLGRMTLATERIARGDFRVSLEENRGDEIGRLARAINRMSEQLAHLLKGHKRFMGDVAHELGSPIGRIQYGLGALEQRVDEGNRQRVQEIMEEVDHMSALVQELLSLSRVEIDKRSVVLVAAELLPMVEAAVKREFTSSVQIRLAVERDLWVVACPNLLIRAVSNLIRNSVKYAGKDGPISISASLQGDSIGLEVCDCGPGIPEEYLSQLFEPFFRPEPSRDRDSGGVGLGLAIVKTCVESCRGSVSVRNLQPHGFAVTIQLVKAPRHTE